MNFRNCRKFLQTYNQGSYRKFPRNFGKILKNFRKIKKI